MACRVRARGSEAPTRCSPLAPRAPWLRAAGSRLRVKDVDFATNQIVIRDGKGRKDRVTMLPAAVKTLLMTHIDHVRAQHQADLRRGAGWVELPGALLRKYPNAGREWGWQWVFPATRFYVDRLTGQRRRHHLHESVQIRPPARRKGRGPCGGPRQARHVPYLPPLLRYPPAGRQSRHPDRPGAPRPPGCEHHHDLHAHAQSGPSRSPKSRRRDVPVVTSLVSDVATTAGAPMLPSSVSQCIWASPPRHALQPRENSSRLLSPSARPARIYGTMRKDRRAQERSR